MGMADLRENRVESLFLSSDFLFQKFCAPRELFIENSGAGLPRKRNPSEKRRAIALCRPILAFQSVAQRMASLRSCLKDAPIWSRRWIFRFARAN